MQSIDREKKNREIEMVRNGRQLVRGEMAAAKDNFEDVDDPTAPALLLNFDELRSWSLYRAVVAEFVATLLFLYVVVASVIGYKAQSAAAAQSCGGIGLLGIAWSFGATIFVLVYCTAGVSGGHINPAVTFGMLVARKASLNRAAMYVVAQCLGAACGAGLAKSFMRHDFDAFGGAANVVALEYSRGAALGAEIVGTFVLVYAVFSAADPIRKAPNSSHVPDVLAPLPIGFAVFVVHLATIPITGTGINPARSFGAAVFYNDSRAWREHWIFWVGPLVGAAAAAAYHKYILRSSSSSTAITAASSRASGADNYA